MVPLNSFTYKPHDARQNAAARFDISEIVERILEVTEFREGATAELNRVAATGYTRHDRHRANPVPGQEPGSRFQRLLRPSRAAALAGQGFAGRS